MKLGFLTACLPGLELEQIAEWAAAANFDALEVAAWRRVGGRSFTASHVDAANLAEADVERIRGLFDRLRLELSSLAYYDNNLHPDPVERKAVNDHVLACVDAAARLGCPTVGTFVGRDPGRTVAENLREAEQVFPPLVERAGERGSS
jgi:sugar phosphate isomerase/epimerase